MLYTKIKPQQIFDDEEKDIKVFLPYMGMASILFNVAEPFTNHQYLFDRRPHVKSGANC